jgi:hypothetical protein
VSKSTSCKWWEDSMNMDDEKHEPKLLHWIDEYNTCYKYWDKLMPA